MAYSKGRGEGKMGTMKMVPWVVKKIKTTQRHMAVNWTKRSRCILRASEMERNFEQMRLKIVFHA